MLDVRRLSAPSLHAIDLSVAPGEMVAVVGPDGAGKTALARTLSGLVQPIEGRIRFLDQDITGADPAEIVRAGLIHVPQGGKVFANLSVHENLLLGATLRNRHQRGAMLAYILGLMPSLAARLHNRAGAVATVDQRRLAIGRGLMAAPRLMILDDPAHDLPPDATEALFDLLARIHRPSQAGASGQGLAIVLMGRPSSPAFAPACGIASRHYVLHDGRILEDQPS